MKCSIPGLFDGYEVYIKTEDGVRLREHPHRQETYTKDLVKGDDHKEEDQQDIAFGNTNSTIVRLECPKDISKSFSIVVVIEPAALDSWDLSVQAIIDGRWCSGKNLHAGYVGEHEFDTAPVCRDGKTYKCPMHFGRLEVTSEPLLKRQDPTVVSGLGHITVKFARGKRARAPHTASTHHVKPLGEICEEKAKGIDRSIKFGKGRLVESTGSSQYYSFENKESNSHGYDHAFVFKYASRAQLQADGIIPHGEATYICHPQPHQQDQPVRSASDEETIWDEIVAMIDESAIIKAAAKMDQERADQALQAEVDRMEAAYMAKRQELQAKMAKRKIVTEIKVEVPAKKVKRLGTGYTGVITDDMLDGDLTLDDD